MTPTTVHDAQLRSRGAAGRALRVAIIGAGPVGLSSALHLRRLGARCELAVFDAQPEAGAALADPRVLALSEGSRQLLEGIGAWPHGAATPITSIHVSQCAPGLASLPRVHLQAEEAGIAALGYTVRYGDLLGALQRAAQLAGIAVQYGRALRVSNMAAGVRLDAATPTSDVPQQADYDLAVVAEGGAFHTQQARALHVDYGQTALIGTLRCERPHRGLAYERFTPDGPVALLPHGPDYALVWCVPPGQAPVVAALEPAAQVAALQALLPAGCGRIAELRIAGSYPLGLNARWSARDARVVQLGNAAQTLHPVAGQGLNLGLRDAAVLARLLAPAGPAPDATQLDAVLRRYDRRRMPDRVALLGLTDLLARGFTWRGEAAAALRAGALAALAGAAPLRRHLVQRMLFGWRV